MHPHLFFRLALPSRHPHPTTCGSMSWLSPPPNDLRLEKLARAIVIAVPAVLVILVHLRNIRNSRILVPSVLVLTKTRPLLFPAARDKGPIGPGASISPVCASEASVAPDASAAGSVSPVVGTVGGAGDPRSDPRSPRRPQRVGRPHRLSAPSPGRRALEHETALPGGEGSKEQGREPKKR